MLGELVRKEAFLEGADGEAWIVQEEGNNAAASSANLETANHLRCIFGGSDVSFNTAAGGPPVVSREAIHATGGV